ncbi:SnoaL-like domain-containing protein [Tropicimonas sp. S265A]|uniref:SnoaL-like domain-containing protein n=1 Tax=Tropicimonas sp. S265A TaxID=3415134 RepID=UPI003C7A43A9
MTLMEMAMAVKTANDTNKTYDLLRDHYAQDCVSVEAGPMPGTDSAEAVGLDAIRAKHEWWDSEMEYVSGTIEGPHLHGDDRFALIFKSVMREKASGKEIPMEEVAIYTVKDDKIAREEFFYVME